MTTDGELLQRYIRGNSEPAFAELVQRHLSLVYAAALRQLGGDAHLAQDVAQTVFTALARKAPALQDRASVAGWLYLGTHHAAAQAVRANQRRRTREMEAQAMHDILGSVQPAADWDRVRPLLDDALRALGETDREAVLLRFFERRPFGDIGAALNLTEDAARMRVDRALDKLRGLLGRRGINSTAAVLGTLLADQAVIAAPAGLATTIAGSALNSATLAGGAVGATFMKTPVLLSGVLTLGAVGAAIFQHHESRMTRAALAEMTRERAEMQAQLRALERRHATVEARAVSAEQQGAALTQQLATATTGKLSLLATATTAATPTTAQTGKMSFYAKPELAGLDPAERKRRIQAMNLDSWDASNEALYRLLGFNAVQRGQFRALRGQHSEREDERMSSAMKSAQAQVPRPERAALQKVFDGEVSRSHAEWLTTVRGGFGDVAVQTIERYYDTIPAREVTRELSAALFYSETPLTLSQAEHLVEIVARHSRNAQGKVDLGAMNVSAIAAEAGMMLTPAQLNALRRAQEAVQRKWAPDAGATTTAPAPRAPGS